MKQIFDSMANIMSMKSVRNKPTRAGYDLTQKINFTAKAGSLIPVWWTPVLPFDDLNATVKSFVRTQPLNTAAFARMRGYFDFYFVPFRQMWNKFPTAITQMRTNLLHASGPVLADNVPLSDELPYFTAEQVADYIVSLADSKNQFGYYRAWLVCIILEYLGYGDFYPYIVEAAGGEGATWATRPMLNNLKFSPFPLFAYQKIYADFNRYTQWERSNPSTFNIDYISGSADSLQLDFTVEGFKDSFNLFDMRYSNWQRDLLHGTIPQAQYGEASAVPVSGSMQVVEGPTPPAFTTGQDGVAFLNGNVTIQGSSGYLQAQTSVGESRILRFNNTNSGLIVEGDSSFGVSILALRRAEAAQKWKEVALASEEDYPSQIEAHWGQSVNKAYSDMCQWLGSINIDLSINEVVNNNITGENAADIAGKGTMSGNGSINFNVGGQYGIVMCVFHVLPQLDYITSAPHFGTTLTNVLDFPIPEFDKIGMEQVPVIRGLNPVKPKDGDFKVSPNLYFGYAPQYYNWKTTLDKSMGEFRRSLKTWIIPFDDEALLAADSVDFPDNPNVEADSVKAGFFKVSPSVLDNLFAVKANSDLNTDQFLCSTLFDVNVVRSLDPNGLPY
ncbi:putative capsid protein (F protein) [Phocaeicola plebeius DSM 17135]|uniref:Putative capsid protein (F protein) n=2 Tax=Phocaeicola plebeius TaxID=310297 RepID=B5CVS1_PHOPM|nr:putative capsid protein (F protein) [Phocaeicola plebeius DSM 17135]